MTDPVLVARQFSTRWRPMTATPVTHGHIHDTYIVTCQGDATGLQLRVPVLDGQLPEYQALVPPAILPSTR